MTDLQVVIMAAGMGSRYGGLKQIDEFGPSKEFLMDYAIYDAYKAGIRHIHLIVRDHFLKDMKDLMAAKWGKHKDLRFEFTCQEITDLPAEYQGQVQREKPWGTAHILYILRDKIKTPFLIMNADDFYGRAAIETLVSFLQKNPTKQALVSYLLQKTLSPFGPVTRGICEIKNNKLVAIDEVSNIQFNDPRQSFASMNLWGFSPAIFKNVEESFKKFLSKNIKELKGEYQIPQMVNDFLREKKIEVEALTVDSEWFGVTHQEDKEPVREKINQLVKSGVYPKSLY